MLNPFVSDCLLSFLKQNEFNETLEKEKVIKGAQVLFEQDSIFYLEEKCLDNLFIFLKIHLYAINILISNTIYQNDFTSILQVLNRTKMILENSSKK